MSQDAPSRRDVLTGRVLPTPAAAPEVHVCSLVIHARPERLDEVRQAMAAMPDVEIHGASPEGKIVITLETPTQHEVVQRMGAIGELPGVLSTALVYHHFEPSSGQA